MKPNESIMLVAGQWFKNESLNALPIFSELTIDFLSDLSSLILTSSECKQYPDIITFAFWCRKANILELKKSYLDIDARLGRGYVFHIAPSNIPVNFAFSFIFSLLAGNCNVVRIPSKPFIQIDLILQAIRQLFKNPKYSLISINNAFIKYEQNNEITKQLSKNCHARVIWGGDNTIQKIKTLEIPMRSIDISFSDRYSFAVIGAQAIMNLNEKSLTTLAHHFYNDTYLIDQNACSSPHLIYWYGNQSIVEQAKKKFWNAVFEKVKRQYEFQPIHAIDKFDHLCQDLINLDSVQDIEQHQNYLHRITLNRIDKNLDKLRGKFGYFYEYSSESLNDLQQIITTKYQTLTYFGIDKQLLFTFIRDNSILGVDRIVPIGQALEISPLWDGYDLIRTLSRICEVK